VCVSVVAGVDASPVLEAAKHAFDLVPLAIGSLVVGGHYQMTHF
jgi:hypothetical protein